jgi:hypothetical protein
MQMRSTGRSLARLGKFNLVGLLGSALQLFLLYGSWPDLQPVVDSRLRIALMQQVCCIGYCLPYPDR